MGGRGSRRATAGAIQSGYPARLAWQKAFKLTTRVALHQYVSIRCTVILAGT
ncbi:hypothetical protein KCP78_20780 [Salmonella enterica subsp. enterica]|nr:hypothetical protein KCP78_20780 [Salmonella enterica subsp. enterica]